MDWNTLNLTIISSTILLSYHTKYICIFLNTNTKFVHLLISKFHYHRCWSLLYFLFAITFDKNNRMIKDTIVLLDTILSLLFHVIMKQNNNWWWNIIKGKYKNVLFQWFNMFLISWDVHFSHTWWSISHWQDV